MAECIQIDRFKIGTGNAPFIIAEMSGNHNQSIEKAFSIIKAAKESGAHAVKIQTYTADSMTIDTDSSDFTINTPGSLWEGKSLYQLYDMAKTPLEWHSKLFEYAKELGIILFSTPFDESSVDFLEQFDPPLYKIASFENTDTYLLKKVAKTKKPVIVSTGMASLSEIDEAVNILRDNGCTQIVLLKCTSSYPAPAEDINLNTIPLLGELFDVNVGLSDHTLGTAVAIASVAKGASVIEKHFVLNRSEGGVDSAFSLEPQEFSQLVVDSLLAWKALGKAKFGTTKAEKDSVQFRRSLYFVNDIAAGEFITKNHIKAIRPGYGLAVKHLEEIIGRKSKRQIKRGTRVSWDLFE